MASRAGSNITTDHDEIRSWAEERGAKPACVRGTGDSGDIGILRLDFPGYSGDDSLEPISWDDWFEKFDERGLALLHQDTTARGQKSNFNKLVSRETAQAAGSGRGSRRSTGSSRTSRTSARSSGSRSRTKASSSRGKSSRSRTASSSRSRGASTKSSGTRPRSASAKRKTGSRSTARKSASTRSRSTTAKSRSASSRKTSRRASSGTGSRSARSRSARTSSSRLRSGGTARKSASTRSQGTRARGNTSSTSRSRSSANSGRSTVSQSRSSRAAQSHILTDHDEIRHWAEERNAKPSCVIGTGKRGDTGMIRLDFPGFSGAGKLKPISWDDWFESFDDNNLALVVQEKTARGQQSNFNKLIGRETAASRARGGHASRRHPERGRESERSNVRTISSGRGDRDQRTSSRGSTRGARTASARGQNGSTRRRAA